MKLILVTGMSGAGKSVALKALEDYGFESLDNIPPAFLEAIAGSAAQRRNLAVGSEVRGNNDFSADAFIKAADPLRKNPALDFKMIFLDSDNEVLRRRFADTGRKHPLLPDRTIQDGIQYERQLTDKLKDAADIVIDTSEYESLDLRRFIASHFAREERRMSLLITSFSFKRGVPRQADIMFDVRFLNNPHYEPDLKMLTGMDAKVGDYIEEDPDFKKFFDGFTGLMQPVLPRYMQRDRKLLTIAVGCTGGRHRSVYVAEKLGAFMKKEGHEVTIRHRDIL